MITSVDPNFKCLVGWIERCYNRFVEKVSRGFSLVVCRNRLEEHLYAHTIDEILKMMGWTKLQQLQAHGE